MGESDSEVLVKTLRVTSFLLDYSYFVMHLELSFN